MLILLPILVWFVHSVWLSSKQISFLNYDQDIIGLISSFAEMGPRAVCVLSASGVVSKVVIHPPGSDGGVLQYEV